MTQRFPLLVIILICLCGTIVHAQTDWSKIEIKVTKVSGNVYMLEGGGGNIGVSVGPDGILIVDDQFAPLADKIKAALKTLGEGKLKFVLNTHYHGDHTGGNVVFGPDALIIAHHNVRKRLSTEQVSKFFNRTTPASPKAALPVITFDQAVSIFFNDEEIKVVHLPKGHTDGDSVVFFPTSNVAHLGDLFFKGRFPVVDLEAGGDVEGVTNNVGGLIERLSKVPGLKIIPGHGPLTDIEGLKSYHRMMTLTTEIVRKRMAAGKTLDQIKAEGLPEEWKTWGSGYINTNRWLELIYTSLSAKH